MIHWIDIYKKKKKYCSTYVICVLLLQAEKTSECRIIEGRFLSPMEIFLPGLVPKESLNAHFQMILPLKWKDEKYKPICIHLAGTGDHVRNK